MACWALGERSPVDEGLRISEERAGLSAFHLKLIALVTMFIDHVGCAIFQWMPRAFATFPGAALMLRVGNIMRVVGRIAFPIYIFLLVEGFFHSSNRGRYLGRLLLFALLSELPFDIALHMSKNELVQMSFWQPGHQNVFWTLAIGLCVIWAVDTLLRRTETAESALALLADIAGIALACAAGIALARFINCDYSWKGVLAIICTYLAKRYSGREAEAVAPALALALVIQGTEYFALLALPFCLLYNGSRGYARGKWLFYVFYPAHLLVLALARYGLLLALG